MSRGKILQEKLQLEFANYFEEGNSKQKKSLMNNASKLDYLQQKTGEITEDLFFAIGEKLLVTHLIECGAHDGSVSARFTNSRNHHALAFEANPYVHAKYKENFNRTNVDYVNIGISSEVGSLDLSIPLQDPTGLSLEASFQHLDETKILKKVKVTTETLDSLAEEFAVEENFAIWIDVEGFAGKVLQGATQVLARTNLKMIHIEVQDSEDNFKNEMNSWEVIEILHDHGFVPIARDYPLANLYNIIFVRSDYLNNIEDLLNQYIEKYRSFRLPIMRAQGVRVLLGIFKKLILGCFKDDHQIILHRIFSIFGSKSSKARILKNRNLLKSKKH